MLPENFTGPLGWKIVQSMPINNNGAEKIVYPVRQRGILGAAKIFRERDIWGTKIDRDSKSNQEYRSYQLTKASSLRQYIPTPIEMISDSGEDVGLLVEWRDGLTLVEQYGKVFLSHQIINELETILHRLPESLWLNPDSLTDKNICWDNSSLWLAEPLIVRHQSLAGWKATVEESMSYLYQNYCR